MKTTKPHRCTQCSASFVPDPRVGARQVTCGAPECQRARHAEQCLAWHRANPGAPGEHYVDAVVPFRQRQPDYQVRWRWGRRLCEIREEMGRLGEAVIGRLRSLLEGAKRLGRRADGVVQTGVLAGSSLDRAVAAVHSALAALEQLAASSAELGTLGL